VKTKVRSDQSISKVWLSLAAMTIMITSFRLAYALKADWFGDEAFYHWESLYPALAYSDLPGMTAWMVHAGEWLFGHSAVATRSLFLLSALLTQLLVMGLANRLGGARAACWAGWLMLLIPVLSLQGSYALPDPIIQCLWAAQLYVLSYARDGAPWAWLLSGLIAALGLMTHLRYGVLLFGVTVTWLVIAPTRQQLKQLWPWLAALIGLAGLLPMLWFESQQDFAQLGFQLVDRHPWTFQPQGLLQPVAQALIVTPIVYLLLLWVGWRAWRESSALSFLAGCGLIPLLFYWLAGLWADQSRFDLHWSAAAYLPLIVLLAVHAGRSSDSKRGERSQATRWLRPGLFVSGLLTLVGMGLLWQVQTPGQSVLKGKWAPENLIGWQSLIKSIGRQRDQLITQSPDSTGPLMLFDHFMPAAQWVARHGDANVRVLNHPMNTRHGRARQLVIWQLDQSAISARGWQGLLVVEQRTDTFATQPAWFRSVCQWLDMSWSGTHEAADQGKWFEFYRVMPRQSGRCELGSFGYLDTPIQGSKVSGQIDISGWVVNQDRGIQSLVVSVNGEPLSADQVTIRTGLVHQGVDQVFAGLTDPDGPRYGFSGEIDLSGLQPGSVRLDLHAIGRNGSRSRVTSLELTVMAEVQTSGQ